MAAICHRAQVDSDDRPVRLIRERCPNDRDVTQTCGRDVEADAKQVELSVAIVSRPAGAKGVVQLPQGHASSVVLDPDLAVARLAALTWQRYPDRWRQAGGKRTPQELVFGAEEDAAGVDGEGGVPFLGAAVDDVADRRQSGVVAQDVEAPGVGDGAGDDVGDGARAGDVRGQADGAVGCAGRVEVGGVDGCSFGEELAGHLVSDA